MNRKRPDRKPLSKEERAALRRELLAILRKPGARERIRRGVPVRLAIAALTLWMAFFSLVFLIEGYLVFELRAEVPLGPLLSDAINQHIFFALKKAAPEEGPDWPRVFELLDEADAARPTPYASFLRVVFLFQQGAPDRLGRVRKIAAAAALLEPDNLLWPLIGAQAQALQGSSREALRQLLGEIPRRPAFRWPLPDGRDRDLLLLVEMTELWEFLPDFVDRLRILTGEAVLQAEEGDPRAARGLAELLDRVARVSIEERQRDESIGRLGLLRAAVRALREESVMVAALPRVFGAGEAALAAERAALVASGGWAIDPLQAATLSLPVALCCLFVAVAASDLLVRFVRSILGQGNPASAWIVLGIPLWKRLVPEVLVGATLGVLWVFGMKLDVPYWTLWAGLLFAVVLYLLARPLRMLAGTYAEPGPWNLRIGKGTLFVRSDTVGVLPLAMAAVFLLFPPRAVNEPLHLLLSPSRMISSWLSVPDDRTASRSQALFAAVLDQDPVGVEAACRAEGIGVPLRVPDALLAGLREQVEILRQERAREKRGPEKPRQDQR